ncbi:hypothetical protein A3H10_00195 [Candidatus Uhrbacteria bacterium RIFCSPLOWO2_12_FULL_46_10]|uniref:Fibronectin type-III domain-containing protein n=1 Tax=Candidatus Uhrbacteria bacterium RIFCSPLOWO2_01_FULL_47_25 TaxID=1802402 RepID=A0A1F7UXJ2_9BACT|nr:MAG: Ricin-type beta-trefoil lectin domain protein [Parcubacteria group bacterium GW2011_GWA2_46_9]OGL58876.1 MAG: hypothetical protein A2752_04830 [Candidatus Uhrbacteria bacterium RIFCSPHIGHO2_01_FULL_46_23]OGL69400.1 MAG: hypothetical protein A3D60_00985 [Candidatus Uhrbacteria bacterium RIFCSPHIGHO2_02_FULL_47_29]OGL76487.1 MAG: hypothetical protein A3E96_03190 [Candidatus Uhrbacteria bacterium RIFCSPHIGHO2_12_FULL_46_13]OGL82438.1 MAG: hypothetical protein A2936_03205 [Candidatus Uhrbac
MKPSRLFGVIVAIIFLVVAQNSSATSLNDRVRGRILLQVESRGEAWYVNPTDNKRTYLRDGTAAYDLLRSSGLGIKNADLSKIPVGIEDRFNDTDTDSDGLPDKLEEGLKTDPNSRDSDNDGFLDGDEVKNDLNPLGTGRLVINTQLQTRLKGKILLQVESKGEAWYINPANGKRYYLKDGNAAYQIMRYLGLGITNSDLVSISTADNLRVTEAKASLLLEWDNAPIQNFSHYNIYRTIQPSDGKEILKENVIDNKYQDTNTENGITYYYSVKVVDTSGQESILSSEVSGRWEKPASPSDVKGVINEKGVQLTWSPNLESDVAGYNIYMSTPKIQMVYKINSDLVTQTFYNDYTSDKSDAYHYYKIKAVDKVGNEGLFSNDLRVDFKPSPPSGFKLTRDYENQKLIMVISWAPVSDDSFSHYELYRSPGSYPQLTDAIDRNLLSNEYKDKNFEGEGLFYFVRTVDKLGIKSDFTRFVVYRDGSSFMSVVDPLFLVKNSGEIP